MNDRPTSSFDSNPSFGTPAGPAAPTPGGIHGPPTGSIALRLPSVPPRVTYTILGITILVYLIQLVTPNYYYSLDMPTFYGAKINELIRIGELWRLITPILLHDHSSILHIAFNMYALFSLGPGLERRFGHTRFLALYLLAGFAGNAFSFLLSSGISLGASTSVFGLVAAEGVFLYQNRTLFGEEGRRALSNVGFIVLINLFIGFSSGGYIDNWGHIGGLLGGLVFAWFGGPLWVVEGIYPLLHLADKRSQRDVLLGAGLVLLIFGALTIVGILWPLAS